MAGAGTRSPDRGSIDFAHQFHQVSAWRVDATCQASGVSERRSCSQYAAVLLGGFTTPAMCPGC